jgi:hypothetical protein
MMIGTTTSPTKDLETPMSLLGESIASNIKMEDSTIKAADGIIIRMLLIYDSLLPLLLKQAFRSSKSCCFEPELGAINVAGLAAINVAGCIKVSIVCFGVVSSKWV